MEQAKLDWMKAVGMKEIKQPTKFYVLNGDFYLGEYVENTPLEILKARHERKIPVIKGITIDLTSHDIQLKQVTSE